MVITTRIRVLSALALALLVAMLAVGLSILLSSPGLVILFLLSGVLILLGGGLLLFGRGGAWWWGAAMTAGALILALFGAWAFFKQPGNVRRLLALIGLSVAYLAVVAALAREYWQRRRAASAVTVRPRMPAVLIVNPKSGDGRAMKAGVPDKAKAMGIDVQVMRPGQDLVVLCEAAIERGARVLGISGGDGSLGVAAKVAVDRNLPLVVLPGGTRCHFARDIGLDPEQILDSLAAFEGVERRVDVGKIGDRLFLNNASFGLYAEIISDQNYRDHKLEVSTKVMRDLAASPEASYPLEFKDGSGRQWRRAAQVLVGVNRYEVLNLDELGERKRLDEGVLQIIALERIGADALRQLAGRIPLGSEAEEKPLAEWTGRTFEITAPGGELHVGVDGESLTLKSPVRVQVVAKALRLLVPAEGQRSRPVKPISAKGARTLWELIKS